MSKLAGIFGILAMILISVSILEGVRINWLTDSMPRGVYRRVNEKPENGMIAASCLTYEIAQHGLERGYFFKGNCDTGIQPVIKPISAVEGDVISTDGENISINGEVQEEYKVRQFDSRGRNLKRFWKDKVRLKKDEYWLMSNHVENSYDSRYFGAVQVEYVVEPVFTVEKYKVLYD